MYTSSWSNKTANTVTINVETGVNIAENRGPLLEMHHAWRHKATADPITPYKMYLFLIRKMMMYQFIYIDKYFYIIMEDHPHTEYKMQPNWSREVIFHAFRSASMNSVTSDDCNVAIKHIQAERDKVFGWLAYAGTWVRCKGLRLFP